MASRPDNRSEVHGFPCPLPRPKVLAIHVGAWQGFKASSAQNPYEILAREECGDISHDWIHEGGEDTP
ncbi:hypothetical protein QPM17_22920 [Marinobacter sp. TBZ242]|uniref:Uncharacterized protein n=1 Tax=Marinobacter azerbaijanicus TaxID=3050455 RepID=A0ABT7ILF6_9GAMM|nr:hypothetical protein [Marinobacter sp. TBZ242]MDL0433998.1 hypothetical protein [Marinobacter sp. TBZ242]